MIVPRDVLRQSEQRCRRLQAAPSVDSRLTEFLSASRDRAMEASIGAGADTGSGGGVAAPAAIGLPPTVALPQPRAVPAAREAHLSFAGALPSPTEYERTIGTNDLVDEFYLERALVAARPVCRITVRDASGRALGYASGFMVSPRLLLTNWHVFRDAAEAKNGLAEFDYTLDIRGGEITPVKFIIDPERFYLSNQQLDFALVALNPVSTDGSRQLTQYGYHRLIPALHKIEEKEWMTIIQYPGGGRRQYAIRENQLIDKEDPNFLWYVSDTAPGSSGAPAFNDSFQVVALHHSGKAKRDGDKYVLKDGTLVDSIDNIDESKIVWEMNEGLRVSRLCEHLDKFMPANHPYTEELKTAMTGGDIMSRTIGERESLISEGNGNGNGGASPAAAATTLSGGAAAGLATVHFNIATVNISNITVAPPLAPAPAASDASGAAADAAAKRATPSTATEKLAEPVVDKDYSSRTGFNKNFLGVAVALPEVTQKTLVAKMDNGAYIIPYEHFSIVMNKKRRLALLTASNVDAAPGAKEPEPGSYKRSILDGIGDKDQEKWVTDDRIAGEFQLPDKFYTKDRQAFDKGHIVRREDVCWGKTRAEVIRANGDTFHTTNCSPQVNDFNQSRLKGIWGELENFILTQAASDKYSIFAGPVLADDDEVFEGYDGGGKVSVQIPRQFWKIVIAVKGGALQAFAFLLEQNLEKVKFEYEFQVNAKFQHKMIRIQDLENMLTGIQFPSAVKNADQYATATGNELVKAVEIAKA